MASACDAAGTVSPSRCVNGSRPGSLSCIGRTEPSGSTCSAAAWKSWVGEPKSVNSREIASPKVAAPPYWLKNVQMASSATVNRVPRNARASGVSASD
jgi:hypothetical protein